MRPLSSSRGCFFLENKTEENKSLGKNKHQGVTLKPVGGVSLRGMCFWSLVLCQRLRMGDKCGWSLHPEQWEGAESR